MSVLGELVRGVTAEEEQAWNRTQLETPVRSPRFHVWLYSKPAVVLGYAQRSRWRGGPIDAPPHWALVERQAGGGAVPVGPWLVGVSVVLPVDHPLVVGGAVNSYRWLGLAHVAALHSVGVAAAAAVPYEVARLRGATSTVDLDWACFGALSAWDVVAGAQRKICGFAQVRRVNGVLLVGGTLVSAPDWLAFCSVLGQPRAASEALSRCTTTCERELGAVVAPAVFASVLQAEIGRETGNGEPLWAA